MTGTRLRWVTRTITAVALFGAATMAPASVSSAWAAEPKLTIDDVRVAEGNTGTRDLVFTVKLSASSSRQVTVDYATGGGIRNGHHRLHTEAGNGDHRRRAAIGHDPRAGRR